MSTIYLLKDYAKGNKLVIRKNIDDQHPILHFHDCIELTIIPYGTGIHFLNGKEIPLNKNDFYLMNFNDSHSMYNMSPENLVYNIMVHPSLISEKNLYKINNLVYHKHISLSENTAEIMLNLFDAIYLAIADKKNYSEKFFSNIIDSILSIFFHENSLYKNEDDENVIPIENSFQKAISFINKNYKENISLTDVANEAFLSPSYLSECFRKKLNLTFKEYLTQIRVTNAKQLLQTTTKPVTFICYESGFLSMATFLRVFNKLENKSPSQYRKEYNKNTQR